MISQPTKDLAIVITGAAALAAFMYFAPPVFRWAVGETARRIATELHRA